jgi:hypothetical protein
MTPPKENSELHELQKLLQYTSRMKARALPEEAASLLQDLDNAVNLAIDMMFNMWIGVLPTPAGSTPAEEMEQLLPALQELKHQLVQMQLDLNVEP